MDLSCGREIQVKFYWLKTEREEMVKKLIIKKVQKFREQNKYLWEDMMWNVEDWEQTHFTKDESWLLKAFLKSSEDIGACFLHTYLLLFL